MGDCIDLCSLCVYGSPSSLNGGCCICPAVGRDVVNEYDKIRSMSDGEMKDWIRGLVTDIRDMPDADVVPTAKWTFVSDGLPPEFEYVLCLSEYSCLLDENYEPKLTFRDYEIRRYIGGAWFGSLTNEEVLAWMPLPEPPVKGEKND